MNISPEKKFLILLIRYFIVGTLLTLVYLSGVFLLHDIITFHHLYATAVSFIFSTFLGYFAHKLITFSEADNVNIKQLAGFWITAISGLIINLTVIHIMVSFFEVWYLFAAVSASAINFLWNFILNKSLVFVQHRQLLSKGVSVSQKPVNRLF